MAAVNQEDHLVAQAANGDQQAFGDLYELYLNDIYRYISFRINNPQDAEDLTEVTFVKAWQSIPRCAEEKASFRKWVFRIAHNTVIDFYRTRKEVDSLDHTLQIPDGTDIEADLHQANMADLLAKGMEQLKPAYQHVLTLRFINGLSVNETADVLERTPGAVRVLQHRALQALQSEVLNDNE